MTVLVVASFSLGVCITVLVWQVWSYHALTGKWWPKAK